MLDLILALLIWCAGLLSGGVLHDELRHMTPDSCVLYEDGAGNCGEFVFPGYDDVEVK